MLYPQHVYIRYHQLRTFYYRLLGITEMTRALHDLAVTGSVAGQSHSQPSDPPIVELQSSLLQLYMCAGTFHQSQSTSSSIIIKEDYSTTHRVPFARPTQPWPSPAIGCANTLYNDWCCLHTKPICSLQHEGWYQGTSKRFWSSLLVPLGFHDFGVWPGGPQWAQRVGCA